MKMRLFLLLAMTPLVIVCALGCGAEEQAKPKILKGGLDADKAKAEQNTKMQIMK
jgi:hypothetical protein